MPGSHAKLSPSAASRWIECPGSIHLTEGMDGGTSEFAEEGTAAHALAEVALQNPDLRVDEFLPNHPLWAKYHNDEMVDHVQDYVDYCRGLNCNPYWIERKYSLAEWADHCKGTADFSGLNGTTLHVVDLKYGKGLKVDAPDNPQLLIYALGVYSELELCYDIQAVQITVHQPRLDHISEWELTVDDLLRFAGNLRAAAALALSIDAPLNPGEKQCQWCPAKAICRARAQANIKAAFEEFAEPMPAPSTLTLDEIGGILPKLDELQSWCKALKDYAFKQALAGQMIKGHKLVQGRSNTKWKEDALALVNAHPRGGELLIKKLVGITEAKKILGAKDPIFTEATEKPPGKATLVVETDRRKAIDPKSAAAADFDEINDDD